MRVSIFYAFRIFTLVTMHVSIHVNVGAHTYVCTCMFMEARLPPQTSFLRYHWY